VIPLSQISKFFNAFFYAFFTHFFSIHKMYKKVHKPRFKNLVFKKMANLFANQKKSKKDLSEDKKK